MTQLNIAYNWNIINVYFNSRAFASRASTEFTAPSTDFDQNRVYLDRVCLDRLYFDRVYLHPNAQNSLTGLPYYAEPLETENDDDSGNHLHDHVTAVAPPRHDDVTAQSEATTTTIGNHRQLSAPVGGMTSSKRSKQNRRVYEWNGGSRDGHL